MGTVLDYARPAKPPRNRTAVWDWLCLGLVAACWALARYAQTIMPGGSGWSYTWEYANFLMTLAAGSALTLFMAGLRQISKAGLRCCSPVVISGTAASGLLLVLMALFARRWLQMNFS